ncbi:MAG: VOC family protein [Candidatus Manganitrophaceae bacterium]
MSNTPSFKLHHIAIQTDDLERSIHFYERILGLAKIKEEQSGRGRRIVWFETGSGRIELYGGKPGQPLSDRWDPNGIGPISLGFLVWNLEESLRHLKEAGVIIIKPPYEPVPGERAAMIQGPNGEEIVLLEKEVRNQFN